MTPTEARQFWHALTDNASSLVVDAHVLLSAGSFARARSLTVLAQEELGKAIWIYDSFEGDWTEGRHAARSVDQLQEHGRNHTRKYLEAFVFGDELAMFWGDYSAVDDRRDGESWEDMFQRRHGDAEAAAKVANHDKQRGFYVDRDRDGTISSPTAIESGTIATDLQTAAPVIEMLLIKDHSRMKLDAKTPYDSTGPQQFRLLAIAHPEDWSAASEAFRNNPPTA